MYKLSLNSNIFIFFIIIFIIFFINNGCYINKKYLVMDFNTFDQSDEGWRHFRLADDYSKAAATIIYYINNKRDLDTYQRMVLNHHAGQMLAYQNRYQEAKEFFHKALYISPKSNKQHKWNAYILATIAFLNKDMPTLLKYKNELESPPSVNGYFPNLPFVKSFIKNFNKSYKQAYEGVLQL